MKKQLLSVLLCLGFFQLLFSQTVTDFTGTDLEGNTHKLFEYLDAGKYVVIKFTQTQ